MLETRMVAPPIFMQPDAESVRAQHARTVEHLRGRFGRAAELLADAVEELLAFTAFPKEHWRQIWSTDPRSASTARSAGAPTSSASSRTREAIIRLVGAVLASEEDRRLINPDGATYTT